MSPDLRKQYIFKCNDCGANLWGEFGSSNCEICGHHVDFNHNNRVEGFSRDPVPVVRPACHLCGSYDCSNNIGPKCHRYEFEVKCAGCGLKKMAVAEPGPVYVIGWHGDTSNLNQMYCPECSTYPMETTTMDSREKVLSHAKENTVDLPSPQPPPVIQIGTEFWFQFKECMVPVKDVLKLTPLYDVNSVFLNKYIVNQLNFSSLNGFTGSF